MIRKINFLVSILWSLQSWCQSGESTYAFQKTMQPAASATVSCPADAAEHAIKEFMSGKGYKPSSFKEFALFRSVKWDESDSSGNDLYFTANKKSRQEKDVSVITLIPTAKNQGLTANTAYDSNRIVRAKIFLDSLLPFVDSYYLNVQVDDQDQLVRKSQKKLNGLLAEEADLNKRIRKLQADLTENKQNQVTTAQELQSNIQADDNAKKKSQKKLNNLMDYEGKLEKKLRNAQLDLDQNKKDQAVQNQDLDKQTQALSALKAKQTK